MRAQEHIPLSGDMFLKCSHFEKESICILGLWKDGVEVGAPVIEMWGRRMKKHNVYSACFSVPLFCKPLKMARNL